MVPRGNSEIRGLIWTQKLHQFNLYHGFDLHSQSQFKVWCHKFLPLCSHPSARGLSLPVELLALVAAAHLNCFWQNPAVSQAPHLPPSTTCRRMLDFRPRWAGAGGGSVLPAQLWDDDDQHQNWVNIWGGLFKHSSEGCQPLSVSPAASTAPKEFKSSSPTPQQYTRATGLRDSWRRRGDSLSHPMVYDLLIKKKSRFRQKEQRQPYW